MFRSKYSTLQLGLALLVSEVHAFVAHSNGAAFSVDTIPASAPHLFNPAAEINRLWAKYPTEGCLNSRQTDALEQQGSVLVQARTAGLSFYSPTIVGNQTFNLIYDTGSANFWVYSNESPVHQSLGHVKYIPTSSSQLLPNYTFSISYARGNHVSGIVYMDIVKVGTITAKNQSVQAANDVPWDFSSDGIVGLASGSINTVEPVKQKTLFETLLPTLHKKVFAADLRTEGNGTWDFGYIDNSKYSGEIAYTPVIDGSHFWEINVQEYAVGEGSFGNTTIGDVIVDSGTSLVYLPKPVVDDYYSQIAGFELTPGGSYTFPCNSTVPDLHFKITGGNILSIPGRHVNYAYFDPAKGTCTGGIVPLMNSEYCVLGNLFMKNYYVIHSREEDTPKMGFASR